MYGSKFLHIRAAILILGSLGAVLIAPVAVTAETQHTLPPLTWEQKSNTCRTLGLFAERVVMFRSMGVPLSVVLDSLHALRQPPQVEGPLHKLTLTLYAASPPPTDAASIRHQTEVECFTILR